MSSLIARWRAERPRMADWRASIETSSSMKHRSLTKSARGRWETVEVVRPIRGADASCPCSDWFSVVRGEGLSRPGLRAGGFARTGYRLAGQPLVGSADDVDGRAVQVAVGGVTAGRPGE